MTASSRLPLTLVFSLLLGGGLACTGWLTPRVTLDPGCELEVAREAGTHAELPALWRSMQWASAEELQARICAPEASRMEVAVAAERLGVLALEEGREAEGIAWLVEAADTLDNPAAMAQLGLRNARGELGRGLLGGKDLEQAAAYMGASAMIIAHVLEAHGPQVVQGWVGAAPSIPAGLTEELRPTVQSVAFAEQRMERYRARYPD